MARLLILGAHPDDAEYHAGGLAARWRARGDDVRMVSVTDGSAGHHAHSREELSELRRVEAVEAGTVIGAEYHVWDFPDGELLPTLELRGRIIREIRKYQPDLVLTHRPNDYHPDHRAVGQAVQDASYLVTVPLVAPNVPALHRDPVVAYMTDLFTRPAPLRPQVVLDMSRELEAIVAMLSCHVSQVFEWLPYNEGILDTVPNGDTLRLGWLRRWFLSKAAPRIPRFLPLTGRSPDADDVPLLLEAYEISEYATPADGETLRQFFPDALWYEE